MYIYITKFDHKHKNLISIVCYRKTDIINVTYKKYLTNNY